MVTYAELVEKHGVKKNESISTFLLGLKKQIEAVNLDQLNRRSWVKEDDAGFTVKLGKLEDEFRFDDRGSVLVFLEDVKRAVKDDADFCAKLEQAYGNNGVSGETKIRRPRKSKNA